MTDGRYCKRYVDRGTSSDHGIPGTRGFHKNVETHVRKAKTIVAFQRFAVAWAEPLAGVPVFERI